MIAGYRTPEQIAARPGGTGDGLGDGGTHLVPSSPTPCAPGCGICLLSTEVDR